MYCIRTKKKSFFTRRLARNVLRVLIGSDIETQYYPVVDSGNGNQRGIKMRTKFLIFYDVPTYVILFCRCRRESSKFKKCHKRKCLPFDDEIRAILSVYYVSVKCQ